MSQTNFEESLKKLDEIVTKMEDKNTSLDDSLELFEKGAKLSAECIKILNTSKGKVEEVIANTESLERIEFQTKE